MEYRTLAHPVDAAELLEESEFELHATQNETVANMAIAAFKRVIVPPGMSCQCLVSESCQ